MTRDRRIVIQAFTATQSSLGGEVKSWSTFATVWASRRDVKGNERFAAEQDIATRAAVYSIHWIDGVRETMRVTDAGVTYEIKGIADNRRQNWIELSVEAVNPPATA
jgi:SPP1 family predicted phage head-tail adaptor